MEALALAAASLVVLAATGFYRPRLNLTVFQQAPRLLMALGVPALALVVAAAVFGTSREMLVQAALFPGLVIAFRVVTFSAIRWGRCRGLLSEPVAILGSGQVADSLIGRMREHPEYGLVPVGYLDDQPNTDFEAPWLGTVDQLERIVRRHGLRRLVVAYSNTREHNLVRVIRTAVQQRLDIHVVPRFFDMTGSGSEMVDEIWGIPLYALRLRALQSRAWRVKRFVDVVVAIACLLVFSPVFAACAVAVRLSSPGPVLYRQLRLGQNGRRFQVLKFRTLRVNDDGETLWSVAEDSRQTRVGRFLRRWNVDEPPQLWNVLHGDMSLIGPRPERPDFVEIFGSSVPDYDARLRVPAGITGWAQVHGLRGDTSIDDRARFDNRYIDNWSLWKDLLILARTLKQIITKGS
jgi:exopolysaccharide biosynthesis polyprenyl glycosylphosphotransferase